MSTTIQSTGLFVEAAYGPEGIPGQNGVTGGGECHDLAWKEAIDSALNAGASLPVQGSALPLLDESSSPINDPSLKENNPLAWDRLSMTVSSMVAWSMQVELSEDDVASEIAVTEHIDGVISDTSVQPFSIVDKEEHWAHGSESVAPSLLGRESELLSEPDGFDLNEETLEQLDLAEATIAAQFEKQPVDRVLTADRSVGELSQEQSVNIDGMEPRRLDLGTLETEKPETVNRTNTSLGASFESADDGLLATNTEPISVDKVNHLRSESVTTAVEPKNHSAMSESKDSVLNVVKHVHSSSVGTDPVASGRERLDGIRSVLAELESQVDFKTVSELVRRPEVNATRIVQDTVQTSDVHQTAPRIEQNAAIKPHASKLATSTQSESMDDGDVLSQVDGGDMQEFSEDPLTSRRVERLDKPIDRRASTSRAERQNIMSEPVNTQAEMSADIAGSENAEIHHDQEQFVELAMEDAQVIEASEVPELAVQDLSSLDIDIDDPMGTVRLAMTRQAEEVSVQLETPQEVLEEYREMREEMEQRLAKQGLDLSHFSADGQSGADQDDGGASQEIFESNQVDTDDPKVTQGGLAEEGSSARLVNRIV